jgi:hypothetical protein
MPQNCMRRALCAAQYEVNAAREKSSKLQIGFVRGWWYRVG